jgi:hypothetical protein
LATGGLSEDTALTARRPCRSQDISIPTADSYTELLFKANGTNYITSCQTSEAFCSEGVEKEGVEV